MRTVLREYYSPTSFLGAGSERQNARLCLYRSESRVIGFGVGLGWIRETAQTSGRPEASSLGMASRRSSQLSYSRSGPLIIGAAGPSSRGRLELGNLLVGELQRGRGDVLLEMLDRRGARDRQHHRRARAAARRARPARRSRRALRRSRPPGRPGSASSPAASGAQGKKAMPELLAALEHVLRAAIGEVEAVLDGDDLDDPARRLELIDRRRWRPDVADLALVLELLQRADRLLVGDLRVGPVELVELDPLEPQAAQRALARLAQVLRTPVGAATGPGRCASARPWSRSARSSGIRMERLGDQLLADVRPVRVGGVDQVDAELDGAPQDRDRLIVVRAAAPRCRGR